MKMDPFGCKLCGCEFQIERYGDGQCPNCGQGYEYDEGHFIVLTDAQKEALRKLNAKPEPVAGVCFSCRRGPPEVNLKGTRPASPIPWQLLYCEGCAERLGIEVEDVVG